MSQCIAYRQQVGKTINQQGLVSKPLRLALPPEPVATVHQFRLRCSPRKSPQKARQQSFDTVGGLDPGFRLKYR